MSGTSAPAWPGLLGCALVAAGTVALALLAARSTALHARLSAHVQHIDADLRQLQLRLSARAVCNVTSAVWRSGCSGMVRSPVFPLLARLGTWSTSATCPCASVTIAPVSDTISFARRPAFIDNRNMT